MARVKRGVVARRRHKKIISRAKGYYNARRKVFRVAKQAVIKAGQYAYIGRKQKKRQFRALWIVRINAGARQFGLSYSRLMNGLKKAGITVDRKVLADIAVHDIKAFGALAEKAKGALAAYLPKLLRSAAARRRCSESSCTLYTPVLRSGSRNRLRSRRLNRLPILGSGLGLAPHFVFGQLLEQDLRDRIGCQQVDKAAARRSRQQLRSTRSNPCASRCSARAAWSRNSSRCWASSRRTSARRRAPWSIAPRNACRTPSRNASRRWKTPRSMRASPTRKSTSPCRAATPTSAASIRSRARSSASSTSSRAWATRRLMVRRSRTITTTSRR